MRRCVEIQVEGLRLRGTFHQPSTRQGSMPAPEPDVEKTGVLLFNSGFLPRSAQGDLLAHLADRIAAAGFPAFRFDLPGLGDSEGDLPEDAVTFVRSVEKGNFAPYASSLAARLVGLHGLEKIIVGGLCGGGITALFGAAASKGSRIGGVLMLDPIFNLVQVQESQSWKKSRAARWKESWLIRMKAVYEELRIPDPFATVERALAKNLRPDESGAELTPANQRPSVVTGPSQRGEPEIGSEF